jgi:hypothetical protein
MPGIPWPLVQGGWVAGRVELRGENPRVMIRDETMRTMAGVMDVGRGHVVVIGHAGIVLDNPELLERSVEIAAGR